MMGPSLLRNLMLAGAMIAASALAVIARPTTKIADHAPRIDLESMIPAQFADWRIDSAITPVAPAPDVQAKLDKFYNQTLARAYVNSTGQRIMLSIAYGSDQSDTMQVHRPEFCYTAQGFEVLRETMGRLATDYGELPIKRLLAVQGNRSEPITYWITVGDRAIPVGMKLKLAQLKYGLTGRIPDGMLVRVSSIDRDEARSFDIQDAFLRQMLAAIPATDRTRIAGRFGA